VTEALFQVQYEPRAEKELAKLDKPVARRLLDAIDRLAENPSPNNSKVLKGFTRVWRLRVGDYRVIYEIRDSELIILVLEIGHRREVYRGI
jgi:mRNA interferase RelE/StbE